MNMQIKIDIAENAFEYGVTFYFKVPQSNSKVP